MAQWHYSSSGTQAGPVETQELARLAKTGGLQPTDLVWKEGMADWVPASRVKGLFDGVSAPQPVTAAPVAAPAASYSAPMASPYSAPAQSLGYQTPGGGGSPVTPRAVEMLRQTKPWVRLFSILLYIGAVIIFGMALILTILMLLAGSRAGAGVAFTGVFIGLITAGMGAFYLVPAMYLGRYASRIGSLTMSNGSSDLEDALEAQKSFWKFWGILTAIILSLYAIFFLLGLVLGGLGGLR